MSSGIAVGELFPRHSKDRKGYIYVHDQGKDLYFEKKYIGIVNIDGEKNEISFIMTKEYSTKIGKVIQKGLGNYIIKFKNKKVFVESAKMLE